MHGFRRPGAPVSFRAQEEVADHGERALGCIRDHRVPASGEPLELHEMRRQCRGDVGLALDRVNVIIFAAEHQPFILMNGAIER